MTRTIMRGRPAGSALLEVLIATAILALATATTIGLMRQHYSAQARQLESERVVLHADRLLEAMSLWTIDDLNRHLGTRQQGSLRVEVQRTERGLYSVLILGPRDGRPLLTTILFRPSPLIR